MRALTNFDVQFTTEGFVARPVRYLASLITIIYMTAAANKNEQNGEQGNERERERGLPTTSFFGVMFCSIMAIGAFYYCIN